MHLRDAILIALLARLCAGCSPCPAGSYEPETTTTENAPARVVAHWRGSAGPVSDECALVVSRATLERVPDAQVAGVCGQPALGCTLEADPAVVVLADSANGGDYAHELVHVLSHCEIGAYDANHRNAAAWGVAVALGGSDR